MPCVDIADSIVQTGRQTLENAIELIHSTARWGARVVYGDTDRYVCLCASMCASVYVCACAWTLRDS